MPGDVRSVQEQLTPQEEERVRLGDEGYAPITAQNAAAVAECSRRKSGWNLRG